MYFNKIGVVPNEELNAESDIQICKTVNMARAYVRFWLALNELKGRDPHTVVANAAAVVVHKITWNLDRDIDRIQRSINQKMNSESMYTDRVFQTSTSTSTTKLFPHTPIKECTANTHATPSSSSSSSTFGVVRGKSPSFTNIFSVGSGSGDDTGNTVNPWDKGGPILPNGPSPVNLADNRRRSSATSLATNAPSPSNRGPRSTPSRGSNPSPAGPHLIRPPSTDTSEYAQKWVQGPGFGPNGGSGGGQGGGPGGGQGNGLYWEQGQGGGNGQGQYQVQAMGADQGQMQGQGHGQGHSDGRVFGMQGSGQGVVISASSLASVNTNNNSCFSGGTVGGGGVDTHNTAAAALDRERNIRFEAALEEEEDQIQYDHEPALKSTLYDWSRYNLKYHLNGRIIHLYLIIFSVIVQQLFTYPF